jgi:hypothetical protein
MTTIHTYKDGLSLAQVSSPRPASARILIERSVNGEVHISSTLANEEETIQFLDEAMECIDGQCLPPDTTSDSDTRTCG